MRILDEPVSPFEDTAQSFSTSSEEERKLRADRRIIYDLFRELLSFVSDFAEKASRLGLISIVDSCFKILDAVMDKTLTLQPIRRKEGVLDKDVMPIVMETHQKCVDNGINPNPYTTGLLHYKIDDLKGEKVVETGLYLTTAYARMGIYSIQKDFYGEIWEWGMNGRCFVKKSPELAKIVIEVLTFALAFLKSKEDVSSRMFYSEARKELESLKVWDKHGHEDVQKKIDEILNKYPPGEPSPDPMELRRRALEQQTNRLLKQLMEGRLAGETAQ